MEYRTFLVKAQTTTGRIFTDYIYARTETEARSDFRKVYRHTDYTIVSVDAE